MTLAELLREAGPPWGERGAPPIPAVAWEKVVSGVVCDSRQVEPGYVFVALRGRKADGVSFAPQAIARGAVAIVAESLAPRDVEVPWLRVSDARSALAGLASGFYHRPSESLTVTGITGTNGKTTTAYLLTSVFEQAGVPCGRIGTVGYRIRGEERDAERTTPEAPDMQRMLREMVDSGCGACVMEVSSHALALRRVNEIQFTAAVFTNLTRDHLDFHGDMESYFLAKRRLFELLTPRGIGVMNLDDPRGQGIADIVERQVTFAVNRPADVTPGPFAQTFDGLAFKVHTPQGMMAIRSGLVGRANVYNIVATVATALALELPHDAIERGITAVDYVPGRFQVVSATTDDVRVVVDYAHTDDALKNLLETTRSLAPARLITVFGCGGDRDPTKRPLMGAVAARLSDVVIVTSDNPRSEDPSRIIEDILRGIGPARERQTGRATSAPREPTCLTLVDRREAIEQAIRDATPGDFVVVAGKGHEKSQVIGDRVLPFDDVEVVRAALARRRAGTTVR